MAINFRDTQLLNRQRIRYSNWYIYIVLPSHRASKIIAEVRTGGWKGWKIQRKLMSAVTGCFLDVPYMLPTCTHSSWECVPKTSHPKSQHGWIDGTWEVIPEVSSGLCMHLHKHTNVHVRPNMCAPTYVSIYMHIHDTRNGSKNRNGCRQDWAYSAC